VIEPFVSIAANPLTDALCREGIYRAARSLLTAFQQGDFLPAREDMSLASLFGGLALANAKLGAVHGFAGVIGGLFSAPHGVICARLLPLVISVNVRALLQRNPESAALKRYTEIAQLVTGDATATLTDGIVWIESLAADLSVPPLSTFGMTGADIPLIVEKSAIASSMKGNPIELTAAELTTVLELAL
jgi:alcohol dehydrogenase class IV